MCLLTLSSVIKLAWLAGDQHWVDPKCGLVFISDRDFVLCLDDFCNLKKGDKGTITGVDDIGQIHVNWDNGSTLALVYGEDRFIASSPE